MYFEKRASSGTCSCVRKHQALRQEKKGDFFSLLLIVNFALLCLPSSLSFLFVKMKPSNAVFAYRRPFSCEHREPPRTNKLF